MQIRKQLKKGVLSILVLSLIQEKDRYGYELIEEMNNLSDGFYALKEGSLYPVFYRLEDDGYIESYKVEVGEKRKVTRKYYKITQFGIKTLDEMKEDWDVFVQATNRIIGG
jgi:PadR family transcriptional regulator PadR